MRLSAVLIPVLLVSALTVTHQVAAQNPQLIVTGTVTDVKQSRVGFSTNSREVPFQVSVRLQYHNRTDETIIVPTTQTFKYGKKQLLFLDLPSLDSRVSASADFFQFEISRSDPRRFLIEKLQESEPPVPYFAIIPPGSSYETGDHFYLVSGWRREARESKSRSELLQESIVPEHAYFKLDYSLSLNDRPETAELLQDAQRRWIRFGKLLLASSGDLVIRSEVIINKPAD